MGVESREVKVANKILSVGMVPGNNKSKLDKCIVRTCLCVRIIIVDFVHVSSSI